MVNSQTPANLTSSVKPFFVKVWGVRGKIATPGQETLRYGGNTACIEMQVANQRLIFDGGTGLRQFGNTLLSQMPITAHLFFTHCHWDRIQGFPFFVPAFIPGNLFEIYGAVAVNGASFQENLTQHMLHPNFPVPLEVMQSDLKFHSLTPKDKINIGGVEVEAIFLNYSQRSICYRVSSQGYSAVYATDTSSLEADETISDHDFSTLIKNVDLLILDSPDLGIGKPKDAITYLQNSTWRKNINLAQTAGVKRILISIYNPDHDDKFLEEVEQKIQEIFPNIKLAKEGMVIDLTETTDQNQA